MFLGVLILTQGNSQNRTFNVRSIGFSYRLPVLLYNAIGDYDYTPWEYPLIRMRAVETEKGAVRPRNDRRRIVPFDMAI